MKNKSKFSKVLKILLVFIAFLGVFFTIRGAQKINIKTKDTSTENQIEYLNNQIDDLNAVISLKNSTIEEQNGTISSQASAIETKDATIASQADTISSQSSTISTQSTRINTLESELSSEYNYQYSIDVDFYVDSELYMSGKARNGGTILIAPTEPTKSGYTFTGWSLTENGTVVDLTNTTISQATSFYAIFEVDAPVWDGTDLTGTSWELKDTINVSKSFYYYLTFSNDNLLGSFDSISVSSPGSNNKSLRAAPSQNNLFYGFTSVYSAIDGWKGSYKTISITGGTDATNTNLIQWLQDNATLVSYTPAN